MEIKKAFLTIPLAEWAKEMGFCDIDEIDFDLAEHPRYYKEMVEETPSYCWDEDEDSDLDDVDEGVWQEFCEKFDLDPSEWQSFEMIDCLRWDYDAVLRNSAYRGWKNAIEAATECLLTHVDIDSFPPVNVVDHSCETAMTEIPDHFPPLEWEVNDQGLQFFGSDAPLVYLLMIRSEGYTGARFAGIRDFKDTYSIRHWEKPDKGASLFSFTGYKLAVDLPRLGEIFGFRWKTDWEFDECPDWSLKGAICRIKEGRKDLTPV